MTDYIALALADQEERENSGTAELLLEEHGTGGMRRAEGRGTGPAPEENTDGGRPAAFTPPEAAEGTAALETGTLTALAEGRTRAWLETAETAASPGKAWPEGTAAVFRGIAPGGGGLYQRLRQARTAAEYRPNRTATALLPAETGHSSGQELARLDRAFQRDARRYDGGFELY